MSFVRGEEGVGDVRAVVEEAGYFVFVDGGGVSGDHHLGEGGLVFEVRVGEGW